EHPVLPALRHLRVYHVLAEDCAPPGEPDGRERAQLRARGAALDPRGPARRRIAVLGGGFADERLAILRAGRLDHRGGPRRPLADRAARRLLRAGDGRRPAARLRPAAGGYAASPA